MKLERRLLHASCAAVDRRRAGRIDSGESSAGLTATPLWQTPQRHKESPEHGYRAVAQIPGSIDARLASAAALGR